MRPVEKLLVVQRLLDFSSASGYIKADTRVLPKLEGIGKRMSNVYYSKEDWKAAADTSSSPSYIRIEQNSKPGTLN